MKLLIAIAVVACAPEPVIRGPGVVPGPPGVDQPTQPIAPASNPAWWCSVAVGLPVAGCDRILANCDLTRNAMLKNGYAIEPCAATAQVWCFESKVPSPDPAIDGTIAENCQPQRTWCERDATRTANVVGGCVAR